jgi:hypothetical protein
MVTDMWGQPVCTIRPCYLKFVSMDTGRKCLVCS